MCKPLLASINSPRLCGHSVVLCVVATRVWFIRYFHTTKKNLGDPGSSRGMFERIRVGLTGYTTRVSCVIYSLCSFYYCFYLLFSEDLTVVRIYTIKIY